MTSSGDARPGPDFLLIGAARAGTTSLARELSRHPSVRFCNPKEPQFLAFHGMTVDFAGPGDRETINRVAITDEGQWRSLFESDSRNLCWGDGSVSTLYYFARSIPAIQRFCPDAKMVAILREPAERAFSAYQYLQARGAEQEPFEMALKLEDERMAANFHHLWHYRHMGLYGEQLTPFVETFGRERVLVLDHAEYESSPDTVLRRCFRFLGLDDALSGVKASGARVNEGGTRPRALVELETRLRANPTVHAALRRGVPLRLRSAFRRIGRERAQIDETSRAFLDDFYDADKGKLRDVLGASAPSWTGP
jgi:hypothetical protein